jgi:hypothetical protein
VLYSAKLPSAKRYGLVVVGSGSASGGRFVVFEAGIGFAISSTISRCFGKNFGYKGKRRVGW